MQIAKSHNYLRTYETTISALEASPESPKLMHQAVLALARAGAVDFAWSEYQRYGLGDITDLPDKKLLEEIMALKGRLFKDMALRTHGKERAGFARQSLQAYERAYTVTGQYFSGINVATMSLMIGAPETKIAKKAKNILALLDTPNEAPKEPKAKKGLSFFKAKTPIDLEPIDPIAENLYYTTATRAECLLLMGHKNEAGKFLQNAIMHDPLNFPAHVSTFKQFNMIMRARNESVEWLEPFMAPRSAHYAGHIFSLDPNSDIYLDEQTQKTLCDEISEHIQRLDIGFGYGALAAGADILIAEALLEEGAELHLILPVPIDQFIATSVSPYGADWDIRFDKCLSMATSLTICGQAGSQWPEKTSNQYATQIAMGRAVVLSQKLLTQSHQLLIWKNDGSKSSTADDAHIWQEAGRKQTIILHPGSRKSKNSLPKNSSQSLLATLFVEFKDVRKESVAGFDQAIKFAKEVAQNPDLFSPTKDGVLVGFARAEKAADFAMAMGKQLSKNFPNANIHIAAHYAPLNKTQKLDEAVFDTVQAIAAKTIPGEIYMSEAFASTLAVFNSDQYVSEYIGTQQLSSGEQDFRLFHLTKALV